MSYVPFDLMTELRKLFVELGDEAAEIDSEANKQLCAELFRLARYRTSRTEDPEDVMQDVLLKLIDTIKKMIENTDDKNNHVYRQLADSIKSNNFAELQRLLKLAVRYKSGEANTRAKRRRDKAESISGEIDEIQAQGTREPIDDLLEAEKKRRLQEILSQLDGNHRDVYEKFSQGKTHQEIASELGLKVIRSRQILCEAKKKAKQLLDGSLD